MGFIKGGDARVFANCKVQESFTSGNFKLFYKELFPGFECVPQLLLGDSVCSLLSHIMKEHEHCSNKAEVIFNQCSGVRNMTESGFSCLKARWRILLRPIDIPVEKLLNIINAYINSFVYILIYDMLYSFILYIIHIILYSLYIYYIINNTFFYCAMTVCIPFIFSDQIEFDLKSVNQEFLLFFKSFNKHSTQYFENVYSVF